MENLKKHKGAFIAAGIIIIILAALFWWGGNAPGMRGWTVGDTDKQIQTEPEQTDKNDETLLTENNDQQQNQNEQQNGEQSQEEQPNNNTDLPDDESNADEQSEKQDENQNETPEPKPAPVNESATVMEINPETGKDKYNTDPVPEGKPLPVEPQDAVFGEAAYTCTFSISCATILDNMDWLVKEKEELVPEDGWILEPTVVTFYEGESVFNVLLRVCKQQSIHMEYSNTPMYNSAYIEGIHNLYEFDCGEGSGWMYKVNDWFPNYGCSRYQLQNGDIIEWVFTCNYGEDVGGKNALG